jgi:predicted phosphodiesterase
MILAPISDIHNEFSVFNIPHLPEDKDTVLMLAGDIDVDKGSRIQNELLPFLTKASEAFKAVIYVLGNHEYYHGSLIATPIKIRETLAHLKNVHFLDNESVAIDDVLIIGSTAWSDFYKADPLTMHAVEYGMNDYRLTRTGTIESPYMRKMTTMDILALHNKAKEYIFNTIRTEKPNYRKIVVMMHHAPTYQSVPERFRGSALNGAFASDLSNEILDTEPDLIIHGHTHDSFDYMVGYYTRVVCNPFGYSSIEENKDFNPTLRIEI